MKVNIVDTKCDFKRSITLESINPKTHDGIIVGLKEIEKVVGKKIIANIRGFRWSIDELEYFMTKGILDNDFKKIIDGKATMIELSEL